ncbi:MAG: twin-arginine translocase TatA/TatE family subunit [Patescibacteria group bacterium]|nr:twin-arginine translocase TatA/TatE family subunit [Patescibacteria group bacterium]
MFNFIKNIGPTELTVIALIIVLFFGSKFLISLGRAGGETYREIKKLKNSFKEVVNEIDNESKTIKKEVS